MLDDYQISKDRDLPKEAWDYMREKGFLGMVIPEEYGETAQHGHTNVVGNSRISTIAALIGRPPAGVVVTALALC